MRCILALVALAPFFVAASSVYNIGAADEETPLLLVRAWHPRASGVEPVLADHDHFLVVRSGKNDHANAKHQILDGRPLTGEEREYALEKLRGPHSQPQPLYGRPVTGPELGHALKLKHASLKGQTVLDGKPVHGAERNRALELLYGSKKGSAGAGSSTHSRAVHAYSTVDIRNGSPSP